MRGSGTRNANWRFRKHHRFEALVDRIDDEHRDSRRDFTDVGVGLRTGFQEPFHGIRSARPRVEFLNAYDSEMNSFPELAGTTHVEFVMADYDLSRDAFFVLFLFRPQALELVAGRGNPFELRNFVEQQMEDSDAGVDSLRERARFTAPPTQVPRQRAVEWLGRDWR